MRILIVDDNPADVEMIKEIFNGLDNCPHHSDVIVDGIDAIKYLKKQHPYENARTPNLMILDLNLPGKSGYEILKELRDSGMHIPVIIYTTSDSAADIRKAYKLNANCYVVKPSEFTQLSHVLRLIGQFWLNVARVPEQGE